MSDKIVVFKPNTEILKNVVVPSYFDDPQQFLNKNYIIKTEYSSVGATKVLYTVPAGKIFVLLSAYYDAMGNNASGLSVGSIETNQADKPFILRIVGKTPAAGETQKQQITMNFGTGLVFYQGTTFSMLNGATPEHSAGIYGFELPISYK